MLPGTHRRLPLGAGQVVLCLLSGNACVPFCSHMTELCSCHDSAKFCTDCRIPSEHRVLFSCVTKEGEKQREKQTIASVTKCFNIGLRGVGEEVHSAITTSLHSSNFLPIRYTYFWSVSIAAASCDFLG